MRFIFLTLGYHPDLAGGAYRYVAEVAQCLAGRGHRVSAIYPNPANRFPAGEEREGVQLLRYPDPGGFFLPNWRIKNVWARALLRRALSDGPEQSLIVLCHAYLAPACRSSLSRAAFLFTGPWAEEYLFSRKSRFQNVLYRILSRCIAAGMRQVERAALRRVACILTISQYYAGRLPVWHGGKLAPVRVVGGGVNLAHFKPPTDREAVRRQLGLAPGQFLFLAVRRLDPRMGLDVLLESFGLVAGRFPQARLWIAGDGPQKVELAGRIAAARLGDRLRLLGLVPEDQLPSVYGAADCTIMPSLDLEGFGLSTAESLACGTPVLGSSSGATPELLTPLDGRLLFPANSVAGLEAKLSAVLGGDLALPSSQACVMYARDRLTWERPVAGLEEAWTHLRS